MIPQTSTQRALQRVSKVRGPISHSPELIIRETNTILSHLFLLPISLRIDPSIDQDRQREGYEPDPDKHEFKTIYSGMSAGLQKQRQFRTYVQEHIVEHPASDRYWMRSLYSGAYFKLKIKAACRREVRFLPPAKLPMPMCNAIPTPRLYWPARLLPNLFKDPVRSRVISISNKTETERTMR